MAQQYKTLSVQLQKSVSLLQGRNCPNAGV